ncbi:hypothetical protein Fmac_011566 [Flemingia macrophylla]|uniref:Uncharacterized protein n=1 Tax=Flemingia macrophylla TaxID=520843 RepID=A0ABD1MMT7_9FABA
MQWTQSKKPWPGSSHNGRALQELPKPLHHAHTTNIAPYRLIIMKAITTKENSRGIHEEYERSIIQKDSSIQFASALEDFALLHDSSIVHKEKAITKAEKVQAVLKGIKQV